MADQQQVTPEDPEVIRRQMEQTRASLAEKIEVLEQKVTGTVEEAANAVTETVQEAKEAVAETVETVKETVENTVETVKGTVESTVDAVRDALDITGQVQRHPWLMVGGSVAVGFLGGLFLGPARPRYYNEPVGSFGPGSEPVPEREAVYTWAPAEREPEMRREPERQQPGWWDWMQSTFGSEIDKLKGMAIGTLAGVVRDMVGQAVPENIKPMVTDVINNVTTKLGGEPIQGRVLPETEGHDGRSSSSRAASSYTS